MKVGIPTMGKSGLEEQVSSHFGRAPTFTIVNTETMETEIIRNIKQPDETNQSPQKLSERGVQTVLCSNLGPKAIGTFEQLGIEVLTGAGKTVKKTLEKWKSGELKEATDKNACQEHRHKFSS